MLLYFRKKTEQNAKRVGWSTWVCRGPTTPTFTSYRS